MLFVSTKNTFDEIQKRHFLLLSEDTNEKDIFGGQFVSMYFRKATINAVNEVWLLFWRSLIKFDSQAESGSLTWRDFSVRWRGYDKQPEHRREVGTR